MTDRESYIRQETVTGVVPMLKGDRQYSFLDLFLSTSGFAIATWCYTQGAYVAQYLSFSRMLINIFCFNIVWVFIECLPVIFATRYGIKAYDYWWGYTSAQIDLMVADQPIIVYKKDKKRNSDGSVKHTAKEMDDLWDNWVKKKEKEGSLVGKKISLSDYLNNKI